MANPINDQAVLDIDTAITKLNDAKTLFIKGTIDQDFSDGVDLMQATVNLLNKTSNGVKTVIEWQQASQAEAEAVQAG